MWGTKIIGGLILLLILWWMSLHYLSLYNVYTLDKWSFLNILEYCNLRTGLWFIRVNCVNENTSNSLWNWFPVAIEQHDASLFLDWRFVADRRFTEPFFLDTLASIPLDQRLSCRTSPEVLAQFDGLDCLEPSGFIFHSSRCGSTLISQLLATSNECIVISEAPVIDSALNLYHQETFDLHAPGILKGILRAFGQGNNKTPTSILTNKK